MKQAILITAYNNFQHLIDIIHFFPSNIFELYIHIDKKSKLNLESVKNINVKNVKLLSRRYKVRWGGLNLLKCILLLAEEALKNNDISYFHLISGQDFPIKDPTYFDVIAKRKIDYMQYMEMPGEYWRNKGMNRVELYHFNDVFNTKKHQKFISLLCYLQRILNIKRSISSNIPKLYGGSGWWSLTRDTLQYVIDYTKDNKMLINRLQYTFCPDEIYFQSVIMNSNYSKNVINDNLRYIDWISGNGGYPAVLDANDFTAIKSSNKLFARKFDKHNSNELKLMLEKDICTGEDYS